MDQTFYVSADHVVPAFAFTREPVRVRQDSYTKGFYANGKLGMSKTYATPETAAMAMFLDNGCTNVRIVE